jgi:hypothetical protein
MEFHFHDKELHSPVGTSRPYAETAAATATTPQLTSILVNPTATTAPATHNR